MHAEVSARSQVWTLHRGKISLANVVGFLCALCARNFQSAYIGLSGGYGQLIDAFFIVALRLFGVPVFLHHHSFSYVTTQTMFSRCIFFLLRGCQHIALCRQMALGLSTAYRIPPGRIRVLSNACFLSEAQPGYGIDARPLTVGFLSNITEEKGIFDFFEVMRLLTEARLPVRGLVAGPVDKAIASRFSDCLAATPGVEHVGPVYGEDKQRFYQRLDVLLFPTKYVNEAEPVTVLEAMSNGVLVVARARGCIAGMIEGAGHAFAEEEFVERATDLLAGMARSDAITARDSIQRAFLDRRAESAAALSRLLSDITGAR